MIRKIITWPTRKIVDWVMADYQGLFPKTTRRMQEINVVSLQLAILVVVLVLVVAR